MPTDAVAFSSTQFGVGIGPLRLSGVQCSGSESHLIECSRSSYIACNSWRRGAGVRCQGLCDNHSYKLKFLWLVMMTLVLQLTVVAQLGGID